MKEIKKETKFSIGTIVTLKSHPLLYNLEVKGDGKLIPPFMVVTEIFVESKNKITHSEEYGERIADRIKYTCVFFDDNKTDFKEVILYESMLSDYSEIHIARKDGEQENDKNNKSLIQEANEYEVPNYGYGDIIFFKTKKFEIFKKRTSVKKSLISEDNKKINKEIKTIQYIVNYSSPEFVVCGIKKNDSKNEWYPNGTVKRKVGEKLFKIKWFNSSQMKFSDIYLPAECFADMKYFESKVPYNGVKE